MLQIVKVAGQSVSMLEIPVAQDKQLIGFSSLSPGIYYLKGQFGQNVFCCKFVKE
ncbi:MAG: hypothetical protein ACKVOK_08290 [Flavobacteriales bacterium]